MTMDPLEKQWGMACHLAAFAGLFTGLGFVLGPLVVWLVKKDQYPFVDDQDKESLNFQISMLIYGVVAALSVLVLIGFVLVPLVAIFDIVMIIIASIAASNGQRFRYPLTIRFFQ